MQTKIRDLAGAIIVFCCLGLIWAQISSAYTSTANTGLPPCVPKPYDITMDYSAFTPEQQVLLRAFVEHVDRQFEEVYLRFCTYIDTLQDTLTAADTATACSTKTQLVYAGDCNQYMTFAAEQFWFKNDTARHQGTTATGSHLRFYDEDGDLSAIFKFPNEIWGNQWEINWPDTFPQGYDASGPTDNRNKNWLWVYTMAGGQAGIAWHRFDNQFVQRGHSTYDSLKGDTAEVFDTIIFPSSSPRAWHYASKASYGVFCKWVDTLEMGNPDPIPIYGFLGYHTDTSFIVRFPTLPQNGAEWEWMTVGDVADDMF